MNENQENLKLNPERGTVSPENKIEHQSNTVEKRIDKQESLVELSPINIESKTEKARVEALENAKSSEIKKVDEKEKIEKRSSSNRRGPINKKKREKSFKQTINLVQNELPPRSRTFSKIIHNKTIEKTSDIVGSTIARPNAILAGAFTAFILTLLTYIVAKTSGYALSGFEAIAAFIIGWIIGLLYDYFRILFTGGNK